MNNIKYIEINAWENEVKILKQFVFILFGSGIIILLLIIKTSIFPDYGLGDYETAIIELRTIVCDNCIETVKTVLSNDDGIISSKISLESKTVSVRYNKTKTTLEEIENYIVNSGYDANDKIADINAYNGLSECCKIWENGENYMKHGEKETVGCKGGCCGN
jgi:copper chaperone CopZ